MNLRGTLSIFVVSFIVGGCVAVVRTPSSAPPAAGEPLERRSLESAGEKLASVATALIGTPYRYGGDDPQGFDCSGLVFYAHDRIGVQVPRTTAEQLRAARRVARDSLAPGDLVFFRGRARKVDHVGIYAGGGRFIHAPRSGNVVTYGYLADPYYRAHFAGAGRFWTTPRN